MSVATATATATTERSNNPARGPHRACDHIVWIMVDLRAGILHLRHGEDADRQGVFNVSRN